MYLNILMERMDGAGPEVKVFLMRYLRRFEGKKQVPVTVKGLVKELGINDRGVSKSLKYLTKGGYLINEIGNSEGRGRPKRRFSPGHELQKLLQKWSEYEQGFHHSRTIGRLLEVNNHSLNSKVGETANCKENEQSERTAPGKVRPLSNLRILLVCTLVAHADQAGVVRDLSLRELAGLVGLSVEQVRWHLKALIRSGYLLHYVPGMAVRRGKGRVKSIFVMRLDHEGAAQKCVLLINDSAVFQTFRKAVVLAGKIRAQYGGGYRESPAAPYFY